MSDSYQIIDLFSGSGGSALGFEAAGFKITAAVEIDKLASESFKNNFPKATIFNNDIREISGNHLLKKAGIKTWNRDKLVILACPPCQGFSTARRNAQRKNDPRNLLIMEFVRMVEEIRPVTFILENVPGLMKGIGFNVLETALNKLTDTGYKMTIPRILEAADYGVPQKRKRLVIMGSRSKKINLALPEPTHRNPKLDNKNLPSWITVRDAISNLPLISAGEKHNKDPLHIAANLSETNLDRLKHTPHNGGSRSSWPEYLQLECHKSVTGYSDVYGRMAWDSPSPTITGGCAMVSKGRFGHPEQNRAISLREAARLQSFPDSFIFKGNFGDIAEQIGNAVPPLLAKEIAKSLLKSLKASIAKRSVSSFPVIPQSKILSSEDIYQVA